jgi:uncharacterized protein YbbC (DUF1343 family)
MEKYLSSLKGKTIAVVANQTTMVGQKHLVDTLLDLGIRIKCVFAPEHGFRGEAGAGEKIKDGIDAKTGLSIVSLYGNHLKPTAKDLENIDLVVFDIQDVGARFYTYISTLQYVMEACAENGIALVILDRPNPNGFYVDGPVLRDSFRSFVGMMPIPVVHGMTIGEYAKMLIGEQWVTNWRSMNLEVITVDNYTHKDHYHLPVRPSPNLPNMRSVYLYPSLCFFEGTAVSIGRGTEYPFQCYGFPGLKDGTFTFTPKDIAGVATDPPYENILCNGIDLRRTDIHFGELPAKLELKWLQHSYDNFPEKEKFFNSFFEKLAGNDILRKQIIGRIPEKEIRLSWEPELSKFKAIRKKYLLYPDFE